VSGFTGFTRDTSKFLRDLGRNNQKAWFDAHRDDYEAHYLEPAIRLVSLWASASRSSRPGFGPSPG
jgi:uncharacterized protein (DUF2461 family)